MSGVAGHQSATVEAVETAGTGRQLAGSWHLGSSLWAKHASCGKLCLWGMEQTLNPRCLGVKTEDTHRLKMRTAAPTGVITLK